MENKLKGSDWVFVFMLVLSVLLLIIASMKIILDNI